MLSLQQIPNALTLLRIVLVVPFALAVLREQFDLALVLFFVAGLSDAVDGFLARQFNWRSRFGAIADPIADKLLLITAYIMLTWVAELPLWLCVVVLGRDLVIMLGALIYHFRVSHYDIAPSIWGKLCTFVQIMFVFLIILDRSVWSISQSVMVVGVYFVAGMTLFSGLNYVWVWSTKAYREIQ